MKTRSKKMFTVLCTLGLALGANLGSATPALADANLGSATPALAADGQCPGSKIESHVLRARSGATAGRVDLYYSSARGGTNCVMAHDLLAGSHVLKAAMTVGNTTTMDYGTYASYAGGYGSTGVFRTNMNGRCVSFEGGMQYKGRWYGWASPRPAHCG